MNYKLVDPLDTSLIDLQDRALPLIGFAGAFRSSELAQLRLADITKTEDSLRVRLRSRYSLWMGMNTKRVQCEPGGLGKRLLALWAASVLVCYQTLEAWRISYRSGSYQYD